MSKKKKLNVIFFPAWFPTKTNSLAGKFVIDHGKAITDYANVVVVYIDQNPDLTKFFEFSREQVSGVEVIRLSIRKLIPKFLLPFNITLYVIATFYLLFKERKKYKAADINHVHVLTRTALLPYLLNLFYGTPYVISEHWSRYLPERNSYKGRLRKVVTKFFTRRSSGIATVSKALKEAMIKYDLYHDNFQIISNALDTDRYSLVEPEKSSTFLILHVSGLNDDVKNVTGILRAAKILCEKQYSFDLVIIGDDPIEGTVIREYAKDLGLINVKFTGKLYGEDLLSYYHKADVFVLNSNFETQSCVLLEAMSCGLPIISTSVGGVPEIMNSDTGILVRPKDDKMLAQTIAKVIIGEVAFDRQKIRNHAVANYSYNSVAASILSFYKAAIG